MRASPIASRKHPGEDGGAHQVGKAVDGDNAIHDGDEGTGRAADLHT